MSTSDITPVPILVGNNSPSDHPQCVTTGVSFEAGQVTIVDELCVVDADGKCVPSTFEVSSVWSDGSIKWCFFTFLVTHNELHYTVESINDRQPADINAIRVEVGGNDLLVHNGDTRYQFTEGHLIPTIEGQTLFNGDARLIIEDVSKQSIPIEVQSATLVAQNDLSVVVEVQGVGVLSPRSRLNIKLQYKIVYGCELIVMCEIHNPQRAMHKNGIWDLGDPGSMLFNKLELTFPVRASDSFHVQIEHEHDWHAASCQQGLVLLQASSGGEHWQSPVHINSEGHCQHKIPGYEWRLGDAAMATGQRSSPALIVSVSEERAVSVVPVDFWQNFPKALSVSASDVAVTLFPESASGPHELQGGERKQHRLAFSFADNAAVLQERFQARSNLAMVSIGHRPDKHSTIPVNVKSEEYEHLISMALDEHKGFLAKRELQDEFGWRHYGEVVADHETLYHDDDSYFISHYNNQYDCIYGFLRQYLLTNDSRWFQLANELAKHVLDIDIYRTEQDRAEYNHGLFWHTDHYRDASTATHRTYSKNHYPDDWSGPSGGGPGPEHCYTSGLTLYYFTTGNMDARNAVIGLTQWISNYYEGTGTILELVKTLISHDVKKLISTWRGNKIFRYRYGFDRGVGNYIRALLDSYELTNDHSYLAKAEFVIGNTFGAADDIEMRHLGNIEHTWYYTVFLQEVVRYLDLKRMQKELDQKFTNTRDSLLHYARWIAENEIPYLLQPEKLEYPNDTWAAQDIRKANILYAAYLYATTNRTVLLERARYFRDYVVDTLGQSETLYFARIQAILLQNYGPSGWMSCESQPHQGMENLVAQDHQPADCLYGTGDFLSAVKLGLLQVCRSFSIKREYQWLKTRVQ